MSKINLQLCMLIISGILYTIPSSMNATEYDIENQYWNNEKDQEYLEEIIKKGQCSLCKKAGFHPHQLTLLRRQEPQNFINYSMCYCNKSKICCTECILLYENLCPSCNKQLLGNVDYIIAQARCSYCSAQGFAIQNPIVITYQKGLCRCWKNQVYCGKCVLINNNQCHSCDGPILEKFIWNLTQSDKDLEAQEPYVYAYLPIISYLHNSLYLSNHNVENICSKIMQILNSQDYGFKANNTMDILACVALALYSYPTNQHITLPIIYTTNHLIWNIPPQLKELLSKV